MEILLLPIILSVLAVANPNKVPIEGSHEDYEALWREATIRLQKMERENEELRNLVQTMEQTCSSDGSAPVCTSTSTCEEDNNVNRLQEVNEDPRWTTLQELAHEFFTLKIKLKHLLASLQKYNSNTNIRFAVEQCSPGPSSMRAQSQTGTAADIHGISQLLTEMDSLKTTFTGFYFSTIIKCQMQNNMFLTFESSGTHSQGPTKPDECDDESIKTVLKLIGEFKKMIRRAKDLIQKSSRRGSHSM